MHQLTGDFYTVGKILGHSLKDIGIQLGISSRVSVHLITEGAYHQPQAVYCFRNIDMPQQVAYDMHGFAVIFHKTSNL